MGNLTDHFDPATPGPSAMDQNNFQVNPRFLEVFHSHIARSMSADPGLEKEARRQGEGYVYVVDPRSSTRGGDVPGEDVLGCFGVTRGRIVPGSYRPNPNYRIVSTAGLPGWPGSIWDGLIASLLEAGQLKAGR